MDLTFSEEQDELRKVVRSFLAKYSDEADVRRLAADPRGHDPVLWRRMAGELGLQGLAVPEEYGGSGFGYVDLGIVFEEAGRALLCGPYFATVALAAEALLRCDDERARRTCCRVSPRARRWPRWRSPRTAAAGTSRASRLTAHETPAGWRLTGAKTYVPDGHLADLLLVGRPHPVRHQPLRGGRRRRAGPRTAPPLPTLDQTRKQARLEFTDTPARLIGTEGDGMARPRTHPRHRLRPARRRTDRGSAPQPWTPPWSTRRSASSTAGPSARSRGSSTSAPTCWWTSSAPARPRTADCGPWTRATRPRSRSRRPSRRPSARRRSPGSRGDNIQVHGGIGFTWEHPAHLYFKRAKSSEALLGTPSYHRELLATRLGI